MRRPALFLAAIVAAVAARAESAGTVSGEFTKFGMGARYLAMGGAATAVADDAAAIYWNPANLSLIDAPELTMMRADILEAGYYHAAAYAQPLGNMGVWAASLQTASVGDIGVTDDTGLERGKISPRDSATVLGWGKTLNKAWSIGLGGEWLRSTIIHSASAFSLDAGLGWRRGPWRGGLSGRHLAGTKLTFSEESSPLPRALQAGLAWGKGPLTFSFDVNDTQGYRPVFAAGAEYVRPLSSGQTLAFRAGYQTRPRDLPGTQGASLGLGWGWDRLQMDYAFLPMGSVDGAQTHRFSVGLRLGGRPPTPLPPPIGDADHDGSPDEMDVCPGTYPGTRVTANGCPKPEDDDGDRVTNGLDECPGTPAGRTVDVRGCLVDDDQDGVLNDVDQCAATPLGRVVDGHGCPLAVRLNVEFANASSAVGLSFKGEIQKAADFLAANPQFTAEVEGHSDERGSDPLNLTLSQRRAAAVRQFLIDHFSISPERITAVGYGESRPIADNRTPDGRQRNRRVVITLTRP